MPTRFELKNIYTKIDFDEGYLVRGPMLSTIVKEKLNIQGNIKLIYDDQITLLLLLDKKVVYRSNNFALEQSININDFDLDDYVYKLYPSGNLEISEETTEFGNRYIIKSSN